ncbi:hypothetical protein GIB67_041288 [Kingdonia uniflora]|uniref:Pentatricopeptide repeat-containing protein n=1 Tax=Kingdonia uniflora TaxID=39325 RepID=A0A7J7NIW6_9MAGN|nr:hypothetical protein GIB67_041288 [Kingdonia uniflora]
MASMVDRRPQSNPTQIIKPSHLISILRNSTVSPPSLVGKITHAYILKSGFASDLVLSNNLLHVYCSCSMVSDARKLFNEMSERDVVSWNTMISGFIKLKIFESGFEFYCEMKREGLRPSQSSFASVLVASTGMSGLKLCREIHGEILKCGFGEDVLVGNALLTAYVKYGDILESQKLFHEADNVDDVSFEILLSGYVQQGNPPHDAFELFKYSLNVQVSLSCFAFSSLISLFACDEVINHGIQIHGHLVKIGLHLDTSITNSLITMYAKSYLLENAVCLFEGAVLRDIVTWNSMIAGYGFNGEGDFGVGLVGRFLLTGMRMNESTFLSFLSCSAVVTFFERARMAHVLALKLKEQPDLETDNTILAMYCRCRSLSYAFDVFNSMEEKDVVSYNTLTGLLRNNELHKESLSLFCLNQLAGFKVNEFIYSSVISSCSRLVDSDIGRQIHGCIIKTGFEKIPPLANSVLEMYSQCRRLTDMEIIFHDIENPDIFTWNTIVIGYAQFGFFDKSIRTLGVMSELCVEFNEFTYCVIIDICSYVEMQQMGEQVHTRIKKLGFGSDTALMNSLLTMYANCGVMEKAFAIFQEIPSRDYISWNAMVCGYAKNDFAQELLDCYVLMNMNNFKPNNLTFASICKLCALNSELLLGLQFHAEVIKRGFDLDITVSNSLITMYGKCGDIQDSSKIFLHTSVTGRDVITWNSMICAYASHGCGREALGTFSEMKIRGIKPNAITFVGVLSACGHAGLVIESQVLFDSMYQEHGVVPREEHYACMVDILSRAGRLKESNELIENMPYDPCSLIWRTLLSACRLNGNIELGKETADKLIQLQPNDSSAYILLSNIYASAENMEEKAEMRRRMGDRRVMKKMGVSLIVG